MKLVIQIPCLNERDQLSGMLADLPRTIEGVDEIEVLVIDDGSTDGTSDRAAELGVHHVVRFPRNRGLSAAFMAGIDAALRLGADVIVNTDADNQYRGEDIARLVAPVVEHRADVVVGDRQTDTLSHFSWFKRLLQRWGSRVVRGASGTRVADATSGFRALSRRAALGMFVHNRFSYTVETIVQGGRTGLSFENVPIRTNPKTRDSRLFKGMGQYLRRNGPVILRAYGMYRPVQTFVYVALMFLLAGLGLVGRFLYFFAVNPGRERPPAVADLVGVGCVVLASPGGESWRWSATSWPQTVVLLEDLLSRVRRLDAQLAGDARRRGEPIDGVQSTGAAPWRRSG